jgi:imidazoleglycerol-phosphate dehydratase
MRQASISRMTKETKIEIELVLDGTGNNEIETGIGFFDHMLKSFSFHSGIDLKIKCDGDLEVDDHHTVEDVGIALGQAFIEALGDKKGITRFGHMAIPMDDSLAMVTIDVSNRPFFVYNLSFDRDRIGTMDTQNFKEFFQAFVNESRVNLHINLMYGQNEHHKIEAVYKAFAKAVKQAITVVSDQVVSTKGVL